MDVMTAKNRALHFKQSRLKKNKDKISLPSREEQKIDFEKIQPINLHNAPEVKSVEINSVKQKNIQLRIDQIKSLREYTFKSGDLKGAQLNESQICRIALDLFFWININPSSVETEEELLALVKKSIKKIDEKDI
ncbi:MAG: hypothetical protein HY934_08500 [Candidatus Firestonebacteria bacterium]|nr:hypothetical protein [Candidatus Firestonebacteria bacterium]